MTTIDSVKEFVGETEADALESATTHFGVRPDELVVRVVPGDLGVSGLGKRTLLLISLKSAASEPPARRPERRGRERAAPPARVAEPRREPEPRSEPRSAPEPRSQPEPRDAPPLSIETGELGPVGSFVERLLASIAKSGEFRIAESRTEGEVMITVRGSGAEELTRGQHGLAAAISHLAQRAAQNLLGEDESAYVELGERRAPVDEEASDARLEGVAREAADEVLRTGEPKLLEPMNSRERFIVHTTIRDVDGVTSESIAEGRGKRVKVVPD